MIRFLPMACLAGPVAMSVIATASPAFAQKTTTQTVVLNYEVKMLASAVGANIVLADIEQQARRACASTAPIFATEIVDEECVSEVVGKAIAKIDDDGLTALYNQSDQLALQDLSKLSR